MAADPGKRSFLGCGAFIGWTGPATLNDLPYLPV